MCRGQPVVRVAAWVAAAPLGSTEEHSVCGARSRNAPGGQQRTDTARRPVSSEPAWQLRSPAPEFYPLCEVLHRVLHSDDLAPTNSRRLDPGSTSPVKGFRRMPGRPPRAPLLLSPARRHGSNKVRKFGSCKRQRPPQSSSKRPQADLRGNMSAASATLRCCESYTPISHSACTNQQPSP